jgi:hypothetical protein
VIRRDQVIRRDLIRRDLDIVPNRAHSQISFSVTGFRDDASSER